VKLAMLGSGSRGNATYLETEGTRLLIDAGFSGSQLANRLVALGIAPESLDGIVLSHDHQDHTQGAGIFARRFGTPIYLTPGTERACAPLFKGSETLHHYVPGQPFQVGGALINPFLTVHDAVDPVGLTVTGVSCGTRVGVATDLGRPTTAARHALTSCHFLILEANHDPVLLRSGPYHPNLQARIASSHGHLSNEDAAQFLRDLLHPGLAGVLLAHLSASCNEPELALEVVGAVLKEARWRGWFGVASQDEPTPLLDLLELRAQANQNGQTSLF
jgi:phosphoribosyl 1,2-cyclic phosphodiesterase